LQIKTTFNNMPDFTLLWHDYETWGVNPRLDRPLQFAAIRTDYDLNQIAEPVELYATPPLDMLPNPEACLVINLTPQEILQKNHLPEVGFINKINQHMLVPGTCTVGYNNLRFDDEVTRFALYRNLFEPYAREWKNGNSRWDLLDPLRLARALRPEGINWPLNQDGELSMRLTDLTAANNIEHTGAHDALADVRATIEMARLLKSKQKKLYDFVFTRRSKTHVLQELDLVNPKMLLHVSGMYPSARGNLAIVWPVARHPTNNNGIVVYDLTYAPDALLSDDIEKLHELLFTKTEDLKHGQERLALKTVHVNKCPVIAPLSTLSEDAVSRFNIDLKLCEDNLLKLKAISNLEVKVQNILSLQKFPSADADLALYDGFFNDKDRALMDKVHKSRGEIVLADYKFSDSRLKEMLFRFKARNYPHTLTESESKKWRKFIRYNLNSSEGMGLSIKEFNLEITRLKNTGLDLRQHKILEDLTYWVKTIQV